MQSMQMNASRVVGPALAGVIYPGLGPAAVFVVNAVTYLFAVIGVTVADFPTRVDIVPDERGLRRLASGFRIAWDASFAMWSKRRLPVERIASRLIR